MTDEFTTTVSVRYRDLDTLNHVNNGVYASYLEEVRFDYLDEVLGGTLEEYPFVVARLELSFERPVTRADELTVATWTTSLGETSWSQAYDVRSDGETVATGETTMVSIDPEAKRPAPIPDAVRERVVEFEGLEVDG